MTAAKYGKDYGSITDTLRRYYGGTTEVLRRQRGLSAGAGAVE
jgi:hypothetical protein